MFDTPVAHGGPHGSAEARRCPEDFQVIEQLSVALEGDGEHLWLEIEKTLWNTEEVALWLARETGIHRLSVGYSGLKDKRAVTRQWFSLHLPGQSDPEWVQESGRWPEGLMLCQAIRHRRKLNRGTHRGNAFRLRLEAVDGDRDALDATLARLAAAGVPNYFGEQRFGRDGGNWTRGVAWLRGGEAPRKRPLKGLWLSAVRAGLFNAVLAERVRRGCWDTLLDGDVLQPEGSRGLFLADQEPDAAARLAAGAVHPTAPLPGRAGMASSGACQQLEERVLADHQDLRQALAREGVDESRRATRLPVSGLEWHWQGGDALILSFHLPTGAFATTVLAELVTLDNGGRTTGERTIGDKTIGGKTDEHEQ